MLYEEKTFFIINHTQVASTESLSADGFDAVNGDDITASRSKLDN